MYFEELLRSRQELRNLSAHIESMREKERTDIAREIHDVLGQSLTALRIDLSWLKKRIPPQHDDLIEKTAVMDDLINDVIFTVRRLSSMLRPGILDDLGLSAAIEWQASEFMKRTGIRCIVGVNEIPGLAEEKAVALFRILQESLTNIIKHAEADEVKIFLGPKGKCLEMRISDNGKGIDAETMKIKGSYGIIGMKERVKALNGEIDISGSSSGTTIKVAIPLMEND
jgi:signal transduction histidine kinase